MYVSVCESECDVCECLHEWVCCECVYVRVSRHLLAPECMWRPQDTRLELFSPFSRLSPGFELKCLAWLYVPYPPNHLRATQLTSLMILEVGNLTHVSWSQSGGLEAWFLLGAIKKTKFLHLALLWATFSKPHLVEICLWLQSQWCSIF